MELIQKEFESNPKAVKDHHVVDTLFSLLDFNKFKEMMLAFKSDSMKSTNKVNNTIEGGFDTFHTDLMEDSMNLLINDTDNAAWKVTHEDTKLKISVLDDPNKLKYKLKTCPDLSQIRKFSSQFTGVKFDKVKGFIGDFQKWITCDKLRSQGGPMTWMNKVNEVKRIDESTNIIHFQIDFPVVSGRDVCLYNTHKSIT
jgi:hypothetical protein